MTQDYINGYISALNNLLFIYRNDLHQLRKTYYEGILLDDQVVFIDRYDYKFSRKNIHRNLKIIREIKNEYKVLVRQINSLSSKTNKS